MIVKALEIKVQSVDGDEDKEIDYQYDLVNYDRDYLWLQFKF